MVARRKRLADFVGGGVLGGQHTGIGKLLERVRPCKALGVRRGAGPRRRQLQRRPAAVHGIAGQAEPVGKHGHTVGTFIVALAL